MNTIKVLVIEDNHHLTEALRKRSNEEIQYFIFEPGGPIDTAKMLKKLEADLSETPVDVILLDGQLWAGLRGGDFVRTIKRAAVPFIGFSSSPTDNGYLRNAGSVGTIDKGNADAMTNLSEKIKVILSKE